jgi:GDP-L-fucose synthase
MKTILITGGSGMVGQHLKEIMPDAIYLSSKDADLTLSEKALRVVEMYSPHTIIHLAAKVGGIMDNITFPADFFDENILINTNILRAAQKNGVKRFTAIISTCIYPDVVDKYPMKEEDLFIGPPPPGNFSYAYAKRCMAVQIGAYNQQYGTKYNYLIPCNLYSEKDDFKSITKMHFITALLKKVKTASRLLSFIQLLGTGKPLRQFMYAGDLARVIKEFVDRDITENCNVAPNFNYTIHEMAQMAIQLSGKLHLGIEYSKPELDGQYRKDVDSSKLLSIIKDFKFTDLDDGMEKVYNKMDISFNRHPSLSSYE